MVFINRESELEVLEDEHAKMDREASLVVIYGRRRIGKTELIKQFIRDKRHIYFLATLQFESDVVRKFSIKAAEAFDDEATLKNPHTTWDGFFEYLVREIKRAEPLILVFDEVTYLIQQNKAIISVIQYYWDEYLKELPIMLILCGSYVGMIEKEVLAYKSPLYGRRTRQLYLDKIGLRYLKEFLPTYNLEELVQAYTLLGGIPFYLSQFSTDKTVFENIEENFLKKDRLLFNDALFLLREELKEPRNYLSILKAISFGKVTPKEISDFTGQDKMLVGKYLDVLRGMKIIERLVPVTEKNPKKSKKGIYRIADNYYNFWLRFIYPNMDYVEEGREQEVMDSIKINFNTFVGKAFEDVAKNFLVNLNKQKRLPFVFSKIGSWWARDKEIDIVALNNKKEFMFGEVKWKNLNGKEVDEILRNLKEKTKNIKFKKGYHTIIGKKIEEKEKLQQELNVLLFDLSDELLDS